MNQLLMNTYSYILVMVFKILFANQQAIAALSDAKSLCSIVQFLSCCEWAINAYVTSKRTTERTMLKLQALY